MCLVFWEETAVVENADGGTPGFDGGVLDGTGDHDGIAGFEEILIGEKVVFHYEAGGDTDGVEAEDFLEGGEEDGTGVFDVGEIDCTGFDFLAGVCGCGGFDYDFLKFLTAIFQCGW
jgi:hypothetical protein